LEQNLDEEEFININYVLDKNKGQNLFKSNFRTSDALSKEEIKTKILNINLEIETKVREISLLRQDLKRFKSLLENSNNTQIDNLEFIDKTENSESNETISKYLENQTSNFETYNENNSSLSNSNNNLPSCKDTQVTNQKIYIFKKSSLKKKRSPYNFFYKEMEKKYHNSTVREDFTAKNIEIAKLWRNLSLEKKYKYEQMAAKDSRRFMQEKDNYKPGAIEKFLHKK
jgi:hypothetical protein